MKEWLKEIEVREDNSCEMCGQEIWNLDEVILLTLTDRFIFDISYEYPKEGVLLICSKCFEELVYEFEQAHNIKHFCGNTIFDKDIVKLYQRRGSVYSGNII